MRKRVLGVAVTAAIVALALFALPLAIAARQLFLANEQAELERSALRAVISVDPTFVQGDPVELPARTGDLQIALYGSDGRLVSGQGPAHAGVAARGALTGRVEQGQEGDRLVTAVPVSSGENVIGAITASTPTASVWAKTLVAWAAMLLLGIVAVVVAVLVARRQARQLNRPLERLAEQATTLGEGDFSVRTRPSGVPEIDATAAALDLTAARLGEMVARERAFAANASHQLRTPLTGLRLGLEAALDGPGTDLTAAAQEAIASADELERTIDDLLTLARTHARPEPGQPLVPAEDMLDDVRRRWHERFAAVGRPLRLGAEPGAPPTDSSRAAVRQILDVLLDNALVHGAGVVQLTARDGIEALVVNVRDEGGTVPTGIDVFERGASGHGGHGIGLALARDLAQAQGGRLLLSQTRPTTVFTLLLPVQTVGPNLDPDPEPG